MVRPEADIKGGCGGAQPSHANGGGSGGARGRPPRMVNIFNQRIADPEYFAAKGLVTQNACKLVGISQKACLNIHKSRPTLSFLVPLSATNPKLQDRIPRCLRASSK